MGNACRARGFGGIGCRPQGWCVVLVFLFARNVHVIVFRYDVPIDSLVIIVVNVVVSAILSSRRLWLWNRNWNR